MSIHGMGYRRAAGMRTLVVGWILSTGQLFGAASVLAADPAGSPVPAFGVPEMPDAGYLVQVLLSLLLVVALIPAAAWLLRRLSRLPGNNAANLRVIGGLSLGARERVILIEAAGAHLLLGVAPGRVQTLHVFSEPPDIAAAGPVETLPFAGRLQSILQGKQP